MAKASPRRPSHRSLAPVVQPRPDGTVQRGGRRLALSVLMLVLFLTFLDNTVVSVVLGSVQSTLHAGVTALQWVVTSYALTFAAAMLAFGMIDDDFGRKRVMLAGAGCSARVRRCARWPRTSRC